MNNTYPKSGLERLSGALNRTIEHLLFGLGALMTAVVALQVFFRYGLNQSLFWSEELARYLLVWLSLLGASVAYYRRMHVGIDIVFKRIPPPLQKIAEAAAHLAALVLFGVMIVYGCQFGYFVRAQISPALNLPKWCLFVVVPVSGAIMAFYAITFLVETLRGAIRDH
jgi:TRAP-type C4-dicarboxylate transport system permease small subunit